MVAAEKRGVSIGVYRWPRLSFRALSERGSRWPGIDRARPLAPEGECKKPVLTPRCRLRPAKGAAVAFVRGRLFSTDARGNYVEEACPTVDVGATVFRPLGIDLGP
jgi:hypothetical protein